MISLQGLSMGRLPKIATVTQLYILILGTFSSKTASQELFATDQCNSHGCAFLGFRDFDGEVASTPTLFYVLKDPGKSSCPECVSFNVSGLEVQVLYPSGMFFEGMEGLKVVDISHNFVFSIDFLHHLPSLEVLNASHNRIPVLPSFANSTRLLEFRAPFNQISKIGFFPSGESRVDFLDQANLKVLDLSNNVISLIRPGVFEHLKNLTELDLSGNHLFSIPAGAFDGLVSIQDLDLCDNPLVDVDNQVFSSLSTLSALCISIKNTSLLQNVIFPENTSVLIDTFSSVEAWRTVPSLGLSCQYSIRTTLEEVALFRNGNCSAAVAGRTSLSLAFEGITRVEPHVFSGPHAQSNLDTLWLSFNSIQTLTAGMFSGLAHLVALDLSNNLVTSLSPSTFSGLSNLEELFLDQNQITVIAPYTFAGLSALRSLHLSRNPLGTLAAHSFSALHCDAALLDIVMQDCSTTSIQADAFQGAEGIRSLFLQSSSKLEVSVHGFAGSGLQALTIESEGLTIQPGAFANVSKLTDLVLRHNILKDNLLPGALAGLSLRLLDLSYNALKLTREDVFANVTVQTLRLQHNSLSARKVNPDAFRGLSVDALDVANNNFKSFQDLFVHLTMLRNFTAFGNVLGEKNAWIGESKFQGLTPDVTSIDVSANGMQRLGTAFGSFHKLKNLSLAGQDILANASSPRAFADLWELEVLDLSGNDLRWIPEDWFADCGRLRELNLRDANVKRLEANALRGLWELRTLVLSDNPRYGSPETGYKRVLRLRPLVFLPLAYLTELSLLNVHLEQLKTDQFQGLEAMQTLDLCDAEIELVEEGAFLGLASLRELRLCRNWIAELPAGSFRGLRSLRELDLHDNRLRAIHDGAFDDLDSLATLDLGNTREREELHNNISTLSAGMFQGLGSLESLSIVGAEVERIENKTFEGLSALETLDLRSNRLGGVGLATAMFDGLGSLRQLNLSGNGIARVEDGAFDGLIALEDLSLEANAISSSDVNAGTWRGLDSLQALRLSHNAMPVLAPGSVEGLDSLQILTMESCGLVEIQAHALDNLVQLREAYFGNNSLTGLPLDLWDGLRELAVVDLHLNRIGSLDPTAVPGFSTGRMPEVRLWDNPLTCTVPFSWVQTRTLFVGLLPPCLLDGCASGSAWAFGGDARHEHEVYPAVAAMVRSMSMLRGDARRRQEAGLVERGLLTERGAQRCLCLAVPFCFASGRCAGEACVARAECVEPGRFWTGDACLRCGAGSFSQGNASHCAACPEGYWSAPGVSACTECAAGYTLQAGGKCNQPPVIAALSAASFVVETSQADGAVLLVDVEFADAGDEEEHSVRLDLGCDGSFELNATAGPPLAFDLSGVPVGVHTVCVRVVDGGGMFGEAETDFPVVVYQEHPAGFALGLGTFESPAGALRIDGGDVLDNATAIFAFQARLPSNLSEPEGEVYLLVKRNQKNKWRFASSTATLESFSMAGQAVAFEGSGWVGEDRETAYKFRVSAQDLAQDTFRIQIWAEGSGEAVYDNQGGLDPQSYGGSASSGVAKGRGGMGKNQAVVVESSGSNLAVRPDSELSAVDGLQAANAPGASSSTPLVAVVAVVVAALTAAAVLLLLLRQRKRKRTRPPMVDAVPYALAPPSPDTTSRAPATPSLPCALEALEMLEEVPAELPSPASAHEGSWFMFPKAFGSRPGSDGFKLDASGSDSEALALAQDRSGVWQPSLGTAKDSGR